MDKLAYAVSVAETGGCTTGTALSANNCHGIMTWKEGTRRPKRYASKEDSFHDFTDLWRRLYGGRCPTITEAKKYSGNHRAQVWLDHVHAVYDCKGLAPAQ